MIAFDHASIGYGKPLIRDLSIRFDPGIHVLAGPSGSGKSTFLRSAAGLIPLLDGSVESGRAIICFQEPLLLDALSVRENLAFAAGKDPERKKRIDEMLRLFDLEDIQDSKCSRISGGQRQRTALAQAFLQKPPVLLLDEALCFQDISRRESLIRLLREEIEKENITCLWVTHSMNEAALAGDDFYLIENGEIRKTEDPVALEKAIKSL